MGLSRREFLAAGTAAATLAVAPRAFAQWQPSQRYPDPSIQIVDQSFARYRLALAKVERLAAGFRWCEGPVWFGDGRSLLWSDIPNNRIMRWDEETSVASVFRKPSNFANGNTRDRQGRLLTCEHGTRRVSRTEYDGAITTVADRYEGKPLNSPNDIVCKSDGSIWFTDPPFGILGYYEGYVAKPELPTNVYRVDGKSGQITVVAGDINRPNGLAFSPDESKHYIIEAGVSPRVIQAYDVADGGTRLTNKRKLLDAGPGTPDGMRCDVDGNLWVGWGMGQEGLDGVSIFNPDGRLIGRINLPERCANLCFGGIYRNRLFMCGSTAIYSLYVNTQGAVGG
ncbi:MAG TPA: SMP-30/gluconolactonase/LRE family protein [Methylomirabilota bacterium]|jgi:gluconolactonase|nr:SMP-30/gluconolactonase/LRE family protein [Methylomirabilota bacterium]